MMRDRTRGSLFGDDPPLTKEPVFDPETAERDNERGLEHMAERAAMLKKITMDMNEEADSQLALLDRVSGALDGARSLLAGAAEKFNKVFETKHSRHMLSIVTGITIAGLVLYYVVFR
ncbi:hypothetical protein CYMTET_43517 [Cymbomonas tetramitiformis]|uniref:t-SNARE coiled-coil homology domain-containing protein n=1 Tax=Cymbomonas tetramitiformis TaxID=36881 RepID=A0AAE0C345_9CHLO|nr:hypothetical protein CYMTET_43517 [Cymbomonas tetramitiformis]